ncbi:type II toxin-antitoxin system RelE/ParE family toxin [Salmonella enterica]|uniref:Type II toxin-antitoxin system RelE/ParE family toxin n=2 Tax=Salmonella enterica I TaxID=59201 RepID=A0A742IDJ5_SALMU|nr:type II toxin-antitoxin system RelE/ParE family toxin [Salmonella enterica]EDW0309405.1 type II toxin-antitoxin system RelE/ParE family toxin [Salmonella enterica subsp. enterica serovar Inverness]EEC1326532.1 type II toxin-antitoxin system RelE/ParE family toxin [Salmonella enterica subsp. enterica serovar Muenchen]HAE8090617.1 type II toxin-antitoxin system RelE/ParE family toxin [Salmonella enterica subsp. enterica serovar Newport]EAS3776730.1 type II toxin-antitoxin system RelE/ParE fami
MSKQYSIEVAPIAYECLRDIESYKSGTIGTQSAAELVDKLLNDSVKNIMEDPERYRFNAHLSERGLMLRERLDVESEYRVLYDFNGEHIEILLFVSMKQDFDKILYRFNILK